MSDEELVGRFWLLSEPGARRMSPSGYRAWMRQHAKQLYKIMLDGLQAKSAKDQSL